MDRKVLWVWLSRLFGEGSHLYKKLYESFGSVEAIYDADEFDINAVPWLFPAFKKRLLDKNLTVANEIIKWCDKYGVKILTPDDLEYPKSFFELGDYPAAIYCYGELPDFDNRLSVTVVGTRDMSVYGKETAYNLGYGLAKAGAVVVSGMAKGIDCTAQKGALYADGTTVAILGCGINVVYPMENYELMLKIMRCGAVITEYPPFTPPNAFNFPKRNRLMSAISKATVVVEAGKNSGSLITANISKKLKKEVFAFPSSVNHYFSEGTNDLLFEQTGKLVTCALDVIEPFLGSYKLNVSASKEKPTMSNDDRATEVDFMPSGFWANDKKLNKTIKKKSKDEKKSKKEKVEDNESRQENTVAFDISTLNENERLVFSAFKNDVKISADSIVEQCSGMNYGTVMLTLTILQVKGLIKDVPGGFYIKK